MAKDISGLVGDAENNIADYLNRGPAEKIGILYEPAFTELERSADRIIRKNKKPIKFGKVSYDGARYTVNGIPDDNSLDLIASSFSDKRDKFEQYREGLNAGATAFIRAIKRHQK